MPAQKLALLGGEPVRKNLLPYGRQTISEDEIERVANVLRSDWLTTGPKVAQFEKAFADFVGTREAVAVSSGTAALHAAAHAIGITRGDEVIVPAITFAATANCVVFEGAVPVFTDVEPATLLIDPDEAEARITPRTKALITVDYGGQPCDYNRLQTLADRSGLWLISDACHALGGRYYRRRVGALTPLSTFSCHPVKAITTGEGGVITTNSKRLASCMRTFRNHGIDTGSQQRPSDKSCSYEMVDLGYNYRITDFQCALGISQLSQLEAWISRRREIAALYDAAFESEPVIRPLQVQSGVDHAYHLYTVRLDLDRLGCGRDQIFAALRAEGIGVNVHYIPVYLHPYYQQQYGTRPGLCPVAERAYREILSLPIFPSMQPDDVEDVIEAVGKVVRAYTI